MPLPLVARLVLFLCRLQKSRSMDLFLFGFSFCHDYSQMSRFANKNHMRLLEPQSVHPRESFYAYFSDLRPESNIAPFLYGFTDDGSSWDQNGPPQNKAYTFSSQFLSNCVSLEFQLPFWRGYQALLPYYIHFFFRGVSR